MARKKGGQRIRGAGKRGGEEARESGRILPADGDGEASDVGKPTDGGLTETVVVREKGILVKLINQKPVPQKKWRSFGGC